MQSNHSLDKLFDLSSTLLIASLVFGFGTGLSIEMVSAAEDSSNQSREDPLNQPHSEGVSAAFADFTITAKVRAKTIGDDSLKDSVIEVKTTDRVVTLEGTASSPEAKSHATALAQSIDGVKQVDNKLTVPSTSKVSAEASHAADKTKRVVTDSWITTKVKSKILADDLTKGFDVSVKTIKGVVLLKGKLANQDAIEHVKNIVGQVDGVKGVDTSALLVAG